MGIERRRYPRVKGPFDGLWEGAAGRQASRVYDLSVGGCYIESLNQQAVGEQISVELDLPEGHVQTVAQVVYSNPNQGFAVQFIEVADAGRVFLQRAVDRLLAEGQAA